MDKVLAEIGDELGQTLCDRHFQVRRHQGNPQRHAGSPSRLYRTAGLDFGKHAVAVTQIGSELSKVADREKWIKQFPMWDWVGGRTSEISAVGSVTRCASRV